MNDKQKAKWELTRNAGMGRFVLLYMIVFGAALTAVTSVFDYFFSFNGFRLSDLYIKVPIYLVGGLITGLTVWYIGEYQYHKKINGIRH